VAGGAAASIADHQASRVSAGPVLLARRLHLRPGGAVHRGADEWRPMIGSGQVEQGAWVRTVECWWLCATLHRMHQGKRELFAAIVLFATVWGVLSPPSVDFIASTSGFSGGAHSSEQWSMHLVPSVELEIFRSTPGSINCAALH
jgi:hypothetical protein